jgi:hypothetical protein
VNIIPTHSIKDSLFWETVSNCRCSVPWCGFSHS